MSKNSRLFQKLLLGFVLLNLLVCPLKRGKVKPPARGFHPLGTPNVCVTKS